jgi:chemotaxis methyl-accepting protein methylase
VVQLTDRPSEEIAGSAKERAFDVLLVYIRRERGMDCSQYKESFLRRRLAARMRARDVGTYPDYLAVLRSDAAEYDALLTSLSINHSCFFRDEPMFDALRYAVLAPLVAERTHSGQKSLSVWSAGCADGEEPYSVAMILSEMLGKDLVTWSLQIHATDVDTAALARARRGLYTTASFRNLQADFVKRYFRQKEDTLALTTEIRGLVTFDQCDISTPPLLPAYDLILCRNVLIYFTREHQDKIVHHLVAHLRPGGHIVLGMTEMMPMGLLISGRLQAVDGRLRIYQRCV